MGSTFALSRHAREEHLNLAPPRQGHWLAPVALALVAHGLLVLALTWGVGWKRDAEPAVFEAELWSLLPVQAAPRAVEPPALPPPPPPKPVAKAEPRPAPPPPGPSEAEIATEQAQKKKAEAEERREREKEAALKEAASKKAAAEKQATDKRAQAEKKAADEKKRDQLRADQMARMMGQAGASGGPAATGTAQQSGGPSPGYGGRVAARIRPNVVFTETIVGNPRAEVEVRTLPDGTITGRRIVKSSGNADWDEAVLKAIDRTATLPRDTDGRVPASMIIGLRPLD